MNKEDEKIGAIADEWFKDPNTPKKSILCPKNEDASLIIEQEFSKKTPNDWTLKAKCPRCRWGFQWTKAQDEARRQEKERWRKNHPPKAVLSEVSGLV